MAECQPGLVVAALPRVDLSLAKPRENGIRAQVSALLGRGRLERRQTTGQKVAGRFEREQAGRALAGGQPRARRGDRVRAKPTRLECGQTVAGGRLVGEALSELLEHVCQKPVESRAPERVDDAECGVAQQGVSESNARVRLDQELGLDELVQRAQRALGRACQRAGAARREQSS